MSCSALTTIRGAMGRDHHGRPTEPACAPDDRGVCRYCHQGGAR